MPLLQQVITKKHFTELCAEEQLSPRGEERDDLRSAMICATVAKSVGAKNVKLEDYQLKFDHEIKEVSQDDFEMKAKAWANAIKRVSK